MFILRSLKYWLTLVLLLVVAIAFVVVWLYVSPTLEARLIEQKLETMRRNISLVQAAVAVDPTSDLSSDDVREFLRYQSVVVDGRISARVVILDATATQVLADSRPGLKLSLGDYPLAARSTLSGTTELGLISIDAIDYATAASVMSLSPSPAGGPPRDAAVVLLIASLDDVQANVAVVRERLALATALALGVAAIVGFIVAWAIATRLRTIEREARVIAAGDFDASVKVTVRDEIGQLADGFNQMGNQLSDAFGRMERQWKRVEVLLDTVDQGIVGLDAYGRITIANRAAEHLLGHAANEGGALDRELPTELGTIWRQHVEDGQSHSVVFDHNAQTIEALIDPVHPADSEADTQSAITLRDVSAETRLDRARKDFLANVSHELKTPLFSLAGYLDILAEDRIDDAGRRRFLGIMQKQVTRMRRLATDLLDLSRLDAGAVQLMPTPCEPRQVVEGVLSEYEAAARSRGITLSVDSSHAPCSAFLDSAKLEQIVRALTDNALKFSPEKEAVGVSLTQSDHHLVLRVTNHGEPIAEEDLSRVFDRFCVGAGTRHGSGAGLGLAIARQLAELMDGQLIAERVPDHSTAFVLTLPLTIEAETAE